jgi:hypothetical protein
VNRIAVRVVLAVLLAVTGLLYLILFSLGSPLWYRVAALLVATGGLLCFRKAHTGAAFAFIPAVSLAAVLLPRMVLSPDFILIPLIAALAVSAVVVAKSGGFERRAALISAAISGVLLASGFGVDRQFTSRIRMQTREMNWVIGNGTPFPVEGAESVNGQQKVVLYDRKGSNYCYDVIFSSALADQLLKLDRSTVPVQFLVTYDFGRVRGFDIRQVAGSPVRAYGRGWSGEYRVTNDDQGCSP